MNFMTAEEYAAGANPAVSDAEAFEERAAILEFMGGFDRETAEANAAPMAAKFTHHVNLYSLRMQAVRLAAKRRPRR